MNLKKGTMITLKERTNPFFGKIYILLEEPKKGLFADLQANALILPENKIGKDVIILFYKENLSKVWKVLVE